MNKKFDEKEIIRLLHELDDYIDEPCKIIICGGAAIIAGFGVERTTGDIDALVVDPKNKSFFESVKQVAENNDLKHDWINDGAKGYIDNLQPSYIRRLIPVNENFKNLHAFFISKADLITMKICAWRELDKKDIDDLGVNQKDLKIINENIEHLSKFDSSKAYKAQLVLSELNLSPKRSFKATEVKTLTELAQFYMQQKNKEPTMVQIVSWKDQVNKGTPIKEIAKNYE
jgi:hypothetical protein